ncbi:MAG: DJ-1/PfpI family protein [Christensenellales bacterium]|jgi:4-methyl-5(b-hydroxyethyl)-thiazole monophosphate biosynthesis
MKRTAVLLYPKFSNYEMSIAIYLLSALGKEYKVFSIDGKPVRSECGLFVCSDCTVAELEAGEFDSLLLTGSSDPQAVLDNEDYIAFIKSFNPDRFKVGAISCSPLFLAKAGILGGRRARNGAYKEYAQSLPFVRDENMDYYEDSPEEKKVILDRNLLTAAGDSFAEFAMEFAVLLGLREEIKNRSYIFEVC